ncbi:hypothetical protein [Fuerstiella marisgermanici]|uniref:Uncharacterized protein n=1 Tax=Fuerstiella marisgermanici TaxID=1891926 RepID=A0A1P8WGX8_9PLAN|nr:hypothetical protein [Fuerstiella marisgermanici]APZ93290.1 hypothetical protein Fuma_02907 [Fuerstiella marisgermanici]
MKTITNEDRVSMIVLILTQAAQGDGLPNERAEAVYSEIMERYKLIRHGFASALIAVIETVLNSGGENTSKGIEE